MTRPPHVFFIHAHYPKFNPAEFLFGDKWETGPTINPKAPMGGHGKLPRQRYGDLATTLKDRTGRRLNGSALNQNTTSCRGSTELAFAQEGNGTGEACSKEQTRMNS